MGGNNLNAGSYQANFNGWIGALLHEEPDDFLFGCADSEQQLRNTFDTSVWIEARIQ